MKPYNIYDIEQIAEAIKFIQSFNITTRVKAQHGAKLWEVKDAIESLTPINQFVFDTDYITEFMWYKQAIQEKRKKEILDGLLKRLIIRVLRDLNELREMEYQTYDGRLVKNPVFREKPWCPEWIEPSRVQEYLERK